MSGDDLFLYASAIWGSLLAGFTLVALVIARVRASRRRERIENDPEFVKDFGARAHAA